MSTSATTEPVLVFPLVDNNPQDAALFHIGRQLQQLQYRFTTVTPDTHAVISARPDNTLATDLRGVFGWNRPFQPSLVPERLVTALRAAQALDYVGDDLMRARVRYSSIGERLFLHSGFPTSERDAVFFGPDTYRFVHLLRRTLARGGRLLELGAGSGAAALSLADRYERLVMTDINPLAVRFARVNAALAGCDHAEVHCGDLAAQLEGTFDAIIANPPFIIDPAHRLYRDGGDLGIAVALRMVAEALPRLAPHGCFVLYTGAPVVDGRDLLAEALVPLLHSAGFPAHYDELDADVFGAELANDAYTTARIERLAVVALTVGRPGTATRAPHHQRNDEIRQDGSAWCWP